MATPASSSLQLESSSKSFGGEQRIYSHHSKELGCRMRLAVYLPPGASLTNRMPVLYWLSGLTCSETNFIEKSGAQRYAAELGLILVCPDTSPRGLNLPGDSDNWDFGVGASFYVDATRAPWSANYRMFSYVTGELIELIGAPESALPVAAGRQSISGHSMGGHGALVCALRRPGLYRSASALAPIGNLSGCAWGRKALAGYLGGETDEERAAWKRWDATELVRAAGDDADGQRQANQLHLLVDQGGKDNFLPELLPQNLVAACKASKVELAFEQHDGYDHGYYFVASFIEKHLRHHRRFLD